MSLNALLKKWTGVAIKSLRKRGVAGTVKHSIVQSKVLLIQQCKLYFVVSPWHPLKLYLDQRFDRRFAVDTAGLLILPEIHSDPRFNGYSPTPHSFLLRWLRRIDVDYSKFTFIDFGCGKGKVLLLAGGLPFNQIIGIDLSPILIRIAADNLTSYLGEIICQTIQLVCGDARDFQIPEEPSIYYLFDPFEAEVIQKVLQKIRDSLVASPRELYILYYVPVHRNLMDQSGFLAPVKQTDWYCIYRACNASPSILQMGGSSEVG